MTAAERVLREQGWNAAIKAAAAVARAHHCRTWHKLTERIATEIELLDRSISATNDIEK